MMPESAHVGSLIPIASYPKSGNTWIRAFLTAWFGGALANLDELTAQPILALRREFDDVTGVSSSDLSPEEIDLLRPTFHRMLAAQIAGPCYVKVHDRWYRNNADEAVFPRAAFGGAVHVVRHPAAVALSYADHLRISPAEAITLMANDNAMLDWGEGKIRTVLPQRLGGWSTHASSWQDQQELPVLTVRYEDMQRDSATAFAAILAFAGIAADPASIAHATAESGFARLRAIEMRDGFRERAGDHAFFRQGSADGWREALDKDLLDKIMADHEDVMGRFGYDRAGTA